MKCPDCQSENTKKNGHTHYGKQNHQCKEYDRQFVEGGSQWFVSDSEKALINKLLLERISLSGICRVCDVSQRWLLSYIKSLYDALPSDLQADGEMPDLESYLDERMDEEISRIKSIKKIQIHFRSTQNRLT